MTRIEGFWIYWGSEHYVWAEREAAPKHKYRFEVSADWRQIGKLWISPRGAVCKTGKRSC